MEGNKLVMPAACYSLSSDERKTICEFWRSLRLPDGYASNFSRCISSDGRVLGLKSHDLHIFLQRLLAPAIRAFLPREVSEPLTELGLFFQELCSKTLRLENLERMKKEIAVILCKLERLMDVAVEGRGIEEVVGIAA